jgi:hypothetical protein
MTSAPWLTLCEAKVKTAVMRWLGAGSMKGFYDDCLRMRLADTMRLGLIQS